MTIFCPDDSQLTVFYVSPRLGNFWSSYVMTLPYLTMSLLQ